MPRKSIRIEVEGVDWSRWLVAVDDGATLQIDARPKAKIEGFFCGSDGRLLVKVHVVPADGAANKRIEEMFAQVLKIPRNRVHIFRGEKSHAKWVKILGLNLDNFVANFHGRN